MSFGDASAWLSLLPGWLQIVSTAWAIFAVILLAVTANSLKNEAVESLEAKIAEADARNRLQFDQLLGQLGLLAVTVNFLKNEAVKSLEAKIAEADARNRARFDQLLQELREMGRHNPGSERSKSS